MKSLLFAIPLAVAALPIAAHAHGCPADEVGYNPAAHSDVAGKGVTDTVLSTIDVAKEPTKIHGRLFRFRRLVIQPGGIVPWHSHAERPAFIFIEQGTMTEHASTCKVPIVHGPGDVTNELHQTSHWWENTGSDVAVILAADLLKVGDDPHMM